MVSDTPTVPVRADSGDSVALVDTPNTPSVEPGTDDAVRAAALRRARRRATGLLVVVGVGFLVAQRVLPDEGAAGFLVAALEAGLVGGLADWFAVVALFRHPLGIPIPHTAVIPRSKDGLGQNLGGFVRDNFLGDERVAERLADPERLGRLGGWLARPANADRIAVELLRVAATVAAAVDREALVPQVAAGARRRLRQLPVSRLAGASLESSVRRDAHVALVTAVLEGTLATIRDNRAVLRRRLGEQSPSWVPPVVDDLVFERAHAVASTFLAQVAADPEHELRAALDDQLLRITEQMQHDEEVADRVADAVQEAVDQALVERWVDAAWDEVRSVLDHAGDPEHGDGSLRALVRDALVGLGGRLAPGADLHERTLTLLAAVAPHVAHVGQREVAGLVEATVAGWDAEDTSRRLELWLGRDLQFVRVNGTVVGALVGVVLHAVTGVL